MESPHKGCPMWLRFTPQLSTRDDFAVGGKCDNPNDHMNRGEFSSIGNWHGTRVISMSLNLTILVTFGEEKGLLEGSNSSVAFLGFHVWCKVHTGVWRR